MGRKRQYDILVCGPTGLTGSLTARHFARYSPPGTRWALAGRSESKLASVRATLEKVNPACSQIPLLHLDVRDAASTSSLAASTRVLVSTIGPYVEYGEPIVAACAAAGTDYVDVAGEPVFADTMFLRYAERASASGARIVHSCGFDAAIADLGALFTVDLLPEGSPIRIEALVEIGLEGLRDVRDRFSPASLRSAVTMMALQRAAFRAASERRHRERWPAGRRVRTMPPTLRYRRVSGTWQIAMPVIDPQVVCRSAAALQRYGPDFTYGQWVTCDRLGSAASMIFGTAAAALLAQLPPARRLMLTAASRHRGPLPSDRVTRRFSVNFVGRAQGRRVVTNVSGGDPAYGESAKVLAETALCLVHDDLPSDGGYGTTATVMGHALIRRLQSRGIKFSVISAAA
jgi:short subunit dehydrogenase-like uncharacterized protein